jgi:hypothetical protein
MVTWLVHISWILLDFPLFSTKLYEVNLMNTHKYYRGRNKQSALEQVQMFWSAPMEAFFGQKIIASVTNSSTKTLECNRWRGRGIPYRKTSTGRVLYRKSDVVSWLESQQLVCSTSEYREVSHG